MVVPRHRLGRRSLRTSTGYGPVLDTNTKRDVRTNPTSRPGNDAGVPGTAISAMVGGLRKKRHSAMIRTSSMSSVSLDDLNTFAATSPNSTLTEGPRSSALSRRARVAKSAVLSLTVEHSRLLAMLASVESLVHSASTRHTSPESISPSTPMPTQSFHSNIDTNVVTHPHHRDLPDHLPHTDDPLRTLSHAQHPNNRERRAGRRF